jgi:hypothetical protein
MDALMNVSKTTKWLGCNSNSHVTFSDKKIEFKLNCFNVAFPMCQRNFGVQKALQTGLLLVFM